MNQMSLLSNDPPLPCKPAPMIEPKNSELTQAVYLWWLRYCGGIVTGYPMASGERGPTEFRRVWCEDPKAFLVAYFDQAATTDLLEHRRRNEGIAEWLRHNAVPAAVVAYDPTAGDTFGDPMCCDLDPLYVDSDARATLASAHATMREGLIAQGWSAAVTEAWRICGRCLARREAAKGDGNG